MDNFETLLKEKGLTKSAFSDMLGVKKQNLNSLLKNPTLETIRRIANTLGCPVASLFANSPFPDFAAYIRSNGKVFLPNNLQELTDVVKKLNEENGK